MKRQRIFFLLTTFILGLGLHLNAVVVSNTAQLETAIANANSGGDKEIILQDGTYILNDSLPILGDGITVRSQSGNRNKVTLRGQGMSGSVGFIFYGPGSNFTVRDMTIGWVAYHAIQIWGHENASNILISNLHILDTGEQMVKITYEDGNPNRSENGVMQNCLLEYSAGVGPQDYIGGIDGHQCRNWTVRNNTFKNISSPSGNVAEHAIHFWTDSQDTLVENNLIINCDRGIGFGLGNRGHVRGIIRNNMIYHSAVDHGFADVAIGLENASNAQVYNNTISLQNSYPYAIEYRFSGTSGGIIKNNLCNKAIVSRDGGSAALGNNITTAQAGWFVNAGNGDLHLASPVSQVVNQGVSISGLTADYDGDPRPQGAGIDIGADEYTVPAAASIAVTSPNGGERWPVGSSHSITWTSSGTVGNVKIEYSTNNGSSWSTIKSSTANDGSYSWTIPNTVSSQCLVRIKEASDGSPADTSAAVFSITAPGGGGALIGLNRTQLVFGATNPGTATGEQLLLIENNGSGTLQWSGSSSASWLQLSPASGTAPGGIRVSVNPVGRAMGTHTGVLTITAPGAANSPQTVSVTLEVYPAGTTAAPFGEFATPVQGAVVSSSIPVTGWVLDDIEVVSVNLYNGSEQVGSAVFVEGARPDVEQAYPDYPKNYRAGWGYMMLTNFLPNGGNGTYTLYARAIDAEGHHVTLGSKTITCDNANAVKPFGAIDTPTQGGTAAGGSFINWGWVLTPQPNRILSSGSTINVYVDGVSLGHPVYNIYRSDIAALFPGYANSNGAVGYFYLDTTAYENGVHTIQWTAADKAGNSDGIGSRYFTILNTGGKNKTKTQSTPRSTTGPGTHPTILPNEPVDLSRFPVDARGPVWIKTGYSENSRLQETYPDDNGILTVETRELERIEIHFEGARESAPLPGYAGYLVKEDRWEGLPIGSTLDTLRGVFYWQPGPGFVGYYPLAFMSTTKNRLIRINIIISPIN